MSDQPSTRKTRKTRTRPAAAGATPAKETAPRPSGRAGNGSTGHHTNGSAPAAAGTAAGTGRGQPAAAASNAIRPRRPQYMISTQAVAGVQPLSADLVEQQLKNAPDIDFIKRIEPPPLLGLQSMGGSAGSLMVARMDFATAQLLQQQAGPRATVERDYPLTFGLDPGPADLTFKNPGVLVPHAAGFTTTIQVTGGGQPLAEAEVYIFGAVWPTQGVTDNNGRCSITILGESPDTIRAVYVKPKLDYWSFWLARPQLVPNGTISIDVKPLGAFLEQFPNRQLMGWGCVAMGLDQIPTTMTGAGVKIAIIDSGAAQGTHRNLQHMGPGLSIVGPNPQAWTNDTIGHGSHCAGIIAGGPAGPNGQGVRGFAPGAEVHICQIFPGGRFSDLVGALDYCMENGIDVVNMSLGGGEPSQVIEERLVRAKQMGVACIVAAGNSGGAVQFPASTPHALAVAAIGKWGAFPDDSYHAQQVLDGATGGTGYFAASFSCFGPEIDVCAPGVAIVSTLPSDNFGAWDGTSMATPHVTGLAALVLAHHPEFKDSYRARDARRVERLFQIIKQSAEPIVGVAADRQGAGMPSAPRALGLFTQPSAIGAGTGAVPDASLEAFRRRLMELVGNTWPQAGQAQPQAMPPPGWLPAPDRAFHPMAARLAPPNGTDEPWRNAPASRGPARTDLVATAPWITALDGRAVHHLN